MARRLSVEGLTIKAALALGFGLTLAVWVLTAYNFASRMSAVEQQAAAVSERYMAAQQLLSTVSNRVLVSSVRLRDALLDPDPADIANHRERLEDVFDELDGLLDTYVPVVDSSEERAQIERVRQEVDALRVTTNRVLVDDRRRTAAEIRSLLNTQVVPRRENVLRVFEEVRALNRQSFVQQQTAVSEIHSLAQRRTWAWLTVALAVSLGIGLIATVYSSRLEQRLRRQRALEAQNARHLQELSARLITAQEEERQSIARELHDEVGQVLTAIKVELAVAERRVNASGGAGELLEDAQAIADAALHTVRDLSHLLHPAMLDDLGLAAAVGWYLESWNKRHAIRTELLQEGVSGRHDPAVELAAYRIVQEALTNVARHAQATKCRVTLRRIGDRIQILVEDDGKGFDAAASEGMERRRGLGLIGMRERAATLRGTLHIQSTLGQGTRVRVELPVSPGPSGSVDTTEGFAAVPAPRPAHG